MKNIIKKAIEGGYEMKIRHDVRYPQIDILYYEKESRYWSNQEIVCDPLFWQALSKNYNWNWHVKAMEFYDRNLTEGFDSAVEWLENIIK